MRVRYIVLISLVFFASVIGIWLLNYRGHLYPAGLGAPDGPGTFGDSFGSINALFAGLAFAGIAVSIFIQTDQLRVSRDEMKAAQDTLKETKDNIAAQNAATQKQSFESTFSQMLSIFTGISSNFHVKEPAVAYKQYDDQGTYSTYLGDDWDKHGRDTFEVYLDHLDRYYRNNIFESKIKPLRSNPSDPRPLQFVHIRIRHDCFLQAYAKLFVKFGDDLGQYYRTLYTMLKFIDTAPISEGDKKLYVKLIRAQLSSHEATMLAMNGLSGYSTRSFNDLIKKYGLLKNCDQEYLLLELLRDKIDDSAFGNLSRTEAERVTTI